MKRFVWWAQVWGLLLFPLAFIQAYILLRPENTAELFLFSFACVLFGVLYAYLGWLVRDSSGSARDDREGE
jgi:hypothetical protein